jgi:pyruvate/2-oxoglutarate dehydrogenase complex dihydrolipoamide acyltransferase (E2) component
MSRNTASPGGQGRRLTGWRKIATALWDAPNDPQIYGSFEIDAGPLLRFIAASRGDGAHITPTHLVGRAVGLALAAAPALNVRMVGARAVPRDSIDVFFITALPGGEELGGVKIRNIDRKSAAEVATELRGGGEQLEHGDETSFTEAKAVLQRLPRPLLRVALRIVAWAAGERAWHIPRMRVSATPFGSAMVSSVGMFGLPNGFAPLARMYRVPLFILAGEIRERPVAVAGRVEVRPVLSLSATIDHRYVDASHLADALAALKRYLEAPAESEPRRANEPPLPAESGPATVHL